MDAATIAVPLYAEARQPGKRKLPQEWAEEKTAKMRALDAAATGPSRVTRLRTAKLSAAPIPEVRTRSHSISRTTNIFSVS